MEKKKKPKINFLHAKLYNDCVYRFGKHRVNRYVLPCHFSSKRVLGFQAINHKNFPISKHFKIRRLRLKSI